MADCDDLQLTQGNMFAQEDLPDEVVESSASGSKTTKIALAGDSLQMTPLPTLPFEMITEILLRLPLKFLVQLKCVCKPWNSLISGRKFARKHLSMSTMNPNLILKYKRYSPEYSHTLYSLRSIFTNANGKQINFPINGYNFHYTQKYGIVGCCHGILCVVACVASTVRENQSCLQTVLWNPTIRKYNTLPSLETSPNHATVFGFGYDRFTDNYKVVAVFRYKCDGSPDYKTKVKVHTLGTNSWRLIGNFPYGASQFRLRSSGKFVSGKLNWLVCLRDSMTVQSIVSLDLGTESYQVILQPDYGEGVEMGGEGVEMVDTLTLGVLRDCLCILHGQDIWLMKEYGNRDSWTKFATIPHLDKIFGDCSCIHQRPFYISEDDQDIWFMADYGSMLVAYDSINGTFKSPTIEIDDLWFSEIYVESLISPCS